MAVLKAELLGELVWGVLQSRDQESLESSCRTRGVVLVLMLPFSFSFASSKQNARS